MDKLWFKARRVISVLLVFAMLASLTPVQVFADEDLAATPAPTSEPAEETGAEGESVPVEEEPAEVPAEEPAETPVEEPAETPVEEPVVTPTEESAVTPIEEPVVTPTEEPVVTPTEEPTVTPTE